jgi:hypothetical protein
VRFLVAVLMLVLAAVAVCQQGSDSLLRDPHQSMNADGGCESCHSSYEGELEPHVFVLPIIDTCMSESCHTAAKIGRSHPVGIDVRRSRSVEAVPENLPLEEEVMISCGSCHQPHSAWLSGSRGYPNQEPELFLVETRNGEEIQIPYYKTYFLRVPGDPEEGFTALCNSCHPR